MQLDRRPILEKRPSILRLEFYLIIWRPPIESDYHISSRVDLVDLNYNCSESKPEVII